MTDLSFCDHEKTSSTGIRYGWLFKKKGCNLKMQTLNMALTSRPHAVLRKAARIEV